MSQNNAVVQSQNVSEMQAMIAKLQAELKAAKAAEGQALRLKVSEKGALSVYGLGRFPVTLYKSQWERLAKAMPTIESFIAANEEGLKAKGE
jgi:hypothetical protein